MEPFIQLVLLIAVICGVGAAGTIALIAALSMMEPRTILSEGENA